MVVRKTGAVWVMGQRLSQILHPNPYSLGQSVTEFEAEDLTTRGQNLRRAGPPGTNRATRSQDHGWKVREPEIKMDPSHRPVSNLSLTPRLTHHTQGWALPPTEHITLSHVLVYSLNKLNELA